MIYKIFVYRVEESYIYWTASDMLTKLTVPAERQPVNIYWDNYSIWAEPEVGGIYFWKAWVMRITNMKVLGA